MKLGRKGLGGRGRGVDDCSSSVLSSCDDKLGRLEKNLDQAYAGVTLLHLRLE